MSHLGAEVWGAIAPQCRITRVKTPGFDEVMHAHNIM